jgi:hypothetical protein
MYVLNLAGEEHTVTATITGEGNLQSISVTFTVISGPNTGDTGTASTNASGQASFTYTGDGGVGEDQIQACFNVGEETVCSNVVAKEWTKEIISLTPRLAQNELNTDHTVTATIQDLKGTPVPDVQVTFLVKDGPNAGDNGTDTTNANGEATFTYTGDGGVGTDAIRACFTNAASQEVCTDYGETYDNDAIKKWGVTCPAIKPNPAELPNAEINEPYSQQFTGFGGVSPYTFNLTSGSLPSELILSPSGLLSGTLTESGTFNFIITATDNNDCPGFREYTLLVCPAITITPDSGTLPGGFVGEYYSQTITTSIENVTYELTGSLPPGLEGREGSYIIEGTPTEVGTWDFTITASTDLGCTASKDYTIEISDVPNSIPTLTDWGLIFLSLAITAFSIRFIKRRKTVE